jgi:hypothetical protein
MGEWLIGQQGDRWDATSYIQGENARSDKRMVGSGA